MKKPRILIWAVTVLGSNVIQNVNPNLIPNPETLLSV